MKRAGLPRLIGAACILVGGALAALAINESAMVALCAACGAALAIVGAEEIV